MKQFVHDFDQLLTLMVRRTPRSFDSFFVIVTRLGDPLTVIAIAVGIGVWAIMIQSLRLAIAAAAIPATLTIGYILKLSFERARPLTDFGYNLRLDSFSFPSGHSSGSMITYGLLAYIAWTYLPAPWSIVAAIVLALIPVVVGISRVYLGVHYPSDVVAGWTLGLIMLAVVIFIVKPAL